MRHDPAHILLSKALDDERLAVLASDNAEISDEQIGFLAQQAIEKGIKAVLSVHGVQYRRTHDLSELIDLLKAHSIAFPPTLESSVMLTPFATQMRYDYLPPEEGGEPPLDRNGLMILVRTILQWVNAVVTGGSAAGHTV